MNEYFQENKRSLLILTALLFLLAIVLYIILLRPLLSDLSSKERAIVSAEDEIELLETRLENFKLDKPELDIEQLTMEKKIPRERELDKYILSLQQLELMTESKIEKVEFVYDSSLSTVEEESSNESTEELEETTDEDEQVEQDGTDDEATDETEEEEETAPTIDPAILNEKPENLQVMTVKITAVSPDYDDFIELLKVIENEERISVVTNLHFLQPTEVDKYFADDPLKTIPFEAELTTFYYTE